MLTIKVVTKDARRYTVQIGTRDGTPYIFIPEQQRTIFPFEGALADLLNEMSPGSTIYNLRFRE
jgi:hypothetical protein